MANVSKDLHLFLFAFYLLNEESLGEDIQEVAGEDLMGVEGQFILSQYDDGNT